MRSSRLIVATFALVLGWTTVFPAEVIGDTGFVDVADAGTLHGDAYIAIVRAERARNAGDKSGAMKQFSAALSLYRRLAKEYPGWQAGIVKERIPYCERELQRLSGAIPEPVAPAPEPQPEPVIEPIPAPGPAPEPVPEPVPIPEPTPVVPIEPEPIPDPMELLPPPPGPAPEPEPVVVAAPEPEPVVVPEPEPEPVVIPEPSPEPVAMPAPVRSTAPIPPIVPEPLPAPGVSDQDLEEVDRAVTGGDGTEDEGQSDLERLLSAALGEPGPGTETGPPSQPAPVPPPEPIPAPQPEPVVEPAPPPRPERVPVPLPAPEPIPGLGSAPEASSEEPASITESKEPGLLGELLRLGETESPSAEQPVVPRVETPPVRSKPGELERGLLDRIARLDSELSSDPLSASPQPERADEPPPELPIQPVPDPQPTDAAREEQLRLLEQLEREMQSLTTAEPAPPAAVSEPEVTVAPGPAQEESEAAPVDDEQDGRDAEMLAEIARLRKELFDVSQDRVREREKYQEVVSLRDELQRRDAMLSDLRKEVARLQEEQGSQDDELTMRLADLEAMVRKLSAIRSEDANAEKRFKALETEYHKALKEQDDLRHELAELDARARKIASERRAREKAEKRLGAVESEYGAVLKDREKLEAEIRELEKKSKKLTAEQKARAYAESKLLELQKDYEEVVDQNTDYRKRVESRDGAATAARLREIEDEKEQIVSEKQALESKLTQVLSKVRILLKEKEDAENGAPEPGADSRYAVLEEEYNRVLAEREALKQRIDEITSAPMAERFDALRREQENSIRAMEAMESARTPPPVTDGVVEDELKALQEEHMSTLREMAEMELRIEKLKTESEAATEQSKEFEAAETKLAALRKEYKEASRERDALKVDVHDLEERGKFEDKYASLKKRYEGLETENTALKKELTSIEKSEARRKEEPGAVEEEKPTKRRGWAFWRRRSTSKDDKDADAGLSVKDHERAAGYAALSARYMNAGSYEEARSVMIRGLSEYPGSIDLKLLAGMLYCREANYDLAIEVLQPVVKADDTNPRARIAMGAALLGKGRLEEARTQLELAVDLNPDLSEGHYDLAQVLLAMNPDEPEKARDSYRKALTLGAEPDPSFEKKLNRAMAAKANP